MEWLGVLKGVLKMAISEGETKETESVSLRTGTSGLVHSVVLRLIS